MAVILGNPVMIAAYQAGIRGNGKPFPDCAGMAGQQTLRGQRRVGVTARSTTMPRPTRSSPPPRRARRRRATTPGVGSGITR